ncbi:hypothetical protein OROHE_015466 [Orobanche hederae]
MRHLHITNRKIHGISGSSKIKVDELLDRYRSQNHRTQAYMLCFLFN